MLRVINLKSTWGESAESLSYNFSFKLLPGKINILLGATGSGKSTLFNNIAGLSPVLSGIIWFEGQRVDHLKPAKRPFVLMFQENNLLLHLDVRTNVTLGLTKKITNSLPYKDDLKRLLEVAGLAKLKKHAAYSLSGGQKQLAALIRCILIAKYKTFNNFNHRLIMLDEPFNGLDSLAQETALSLIEQEFKLKQQSLLLAMHDLALAKEIADETWQITAIDLEVGVVKNSPD